MWATELAPTHSRHVVSPSIHDLLLAWALTLPGGHTREMFHAFSPLKNPNTSPFTPPLS